VARGSIKRQRQFNLLQNQYREPGYLFEFGGKYYLWEQLAQKMLEARRTPVLQHILSKMKEKGVKGLTVRELHQLYDYE
jgi:hypothetical protein